MIFHAPTVARRTAVGSKPWGRPEYGDLDTEYRSLSPWLKRKLVSRFGIAGHDADDVVQESFIRLGRYSVADRSKHPRALLMRIASNLSMDGYRRAAVRGGGRHVPIEEVDVHSAPSLIYPADQEALVELKRTILGLPPHLRDTFVLARFTPMTHAEIASHLSISTKTVEWRIKKAVSICLARFER
jgi:RNA polymerase sigma factor (sigma-70 family)